MSYKIINIKQIGKVIKKDNKKIVKIYLSEGYYTTVDFKDYKKIKGVYWFLCRDCRYNTGHYVATIKQLSNGKIIFTSLHKFLFGNNIKKGLVIDHKDGNDLNNCRENIRICTRQQNCMNRRKDYRKTSSTYKGVSFQSNNKRWISGIRYKNKLHYLGCYKTEIEAALAYNLGALEYHKQYARLNENIGE